MTSVLLVSLVFFNFPSMHLLFSLCVSLVLCSDQPNGWSREDEEEALKEAKRQEQSKDHIEREFGEYDKDGNGILDAADIRSKFGNVLDPEMLFQFFSDADLDQTGTITIDEYMNYIDLVGARVSKKDKTKDT